MNKRYARYLLLLLVSNALAFGAFFLIVHDVGFWIASLATVLAYLSGRMDGALTSQERRSRVRPMKPTSED